MLSSVAKLQKFFKLEVERGYDNRAVVGGLDKILPSWEIEARSNLLDEQTIQTIVDGLKSYPELEPDGRAEKLNQLLICLPQGGSLAEISARVETPENSSMEDEPAVEGSPARRGSARTYHEPVRQAPTHERSGQSQHAAEPDSGLSGLQASLKVIPGIGNRYAQALSGLGLATIDDLLYYFPRRYDDYSQLKPINRLSYGEEATVLGTIQNIFSRAVRGGKIQLTEAVVGDGTGFLRVSWFNQPWLAGKFTAGTQLVLAGKIDQHLGRLTMNNPEAELIEQEHLHTNRIVPVYPLTARVTQKLLRRIIFQAVNYWAPRIPDYLPENVRSAVKVVNLSTALQNIHFPESQDSLDIARWRLAFDEIFLLQMGVQRLKRTWQAAAAQVYEVSDEWLHEQVSQLPYELTSAQQRVLQDIRTDLGSAHPMDRLIQGDVGSGKTIVAAMSIAIVTRQGAQAAVMAPTSILAEQHYRSLSGVLAQDVEDRSSLLRPEEVRLLVGDTPESEKQVIRAGLEDGSIKLVIGTHALIEDPIVFQRLQLVVVDEQHRFGVAQRASLRSKGENPHLLVMTATPIPRSLALTVYGDLDLSVMDEMPPGRQPVSTHVLRPIERERAYSLIDAQVKEGRQAFIIYPLVEQGENGDSLAAVEEHQRLQKGVFPKLKMGLLHGRMRPDEKDQVMKQFRDREFNILVSTTVVEVGVDIPNASVMLIEGANRFGLAQLHQLRGRVGRGQDQSHCLLIPDNEDAVENERLLVMAETNDGFELAERDLQQRGPGEFLGTRQAGYSELKMASLTDVRLIEKAREQAQLLFMSDPDLSAPEHEPLVKKLEQFWGGGRGDIS